MNRNVSRDAVLALVVLGVWLLMPPVLNYVDQDGAILGVPQIVVFVFGTWLGLIVLTFLLSRRLPRAGGPSPADGAEGS